MRRNNLSPYPSFGSAITDLQYVNDTNRNYRYGFNGEEVDPEGMGGGGSTYDYGFRIYNPNIGKFLSIDPLTGCFPFLTPYQFADNIPTRLIDLDGKESEDPLDDPMFLSRLILTTIFEIKHSVYNGVFYFYNHGAVEPLKAQYVKDRYGDETWETEFVVDWDWFSKGPLERSLNFALDVTTVYAGGKSFCKPDATDFLGAKDLSGSSQVPKALKLAVNKVFHKGIDVIKNTQLNGTWVPQNRTNVNGAEYQSKLSGKKYNRATGMIDEYQYNDVYFDGYSNGILFDTKDNYSWAIDKTTGLFQDWYVTGGGQGMIKEARNQIAAANGVKLQWIFSQEDSMHATYEMLKDAGVDVSKIEFKVVVVKSE